MTIARVVALGGFVLAVASLSPAAGRAADPSFDCDRARGEVETLICGDDELAALDVDLAKAFAGALARSPANGVNDLKLAQRAWAKERDACRRSDDMRACALAAYRKRLDEI